MWNKFVCIVIITSLLVRVDSLEKFTNTTEYEDDSVVIEVSPIRQPRETHQLPAHWIPLTRGSNCSTSYGIVGTCVDVTSCYSRQIDGYFLRYIWGSAQSWSVRDRDGCSFINEIGLHVPGICCGSNNREDHDFKENKNHFHIPNQVDNNLNNDFIDEAIKGRQGSPHQYQFLWPQQAIYPLAAPAWPPPLPTHGPSISKWPPPIPTHPPNHHYPTHPPHPALPTTSAPTRPSSSRPNPARPTPTRPTYPTHKPTQRPSHPPYTTTARPSYPTYPVTQKPVTTTEKPTTTAIRCGVKNGVSPDQQRIVGGENSSPNEWPWVVVLFNRGRQFCGGSLIDDIHVLTAAHCVAKMTSWDVAGLTANLGDHNIRTSFEVQHVERRIKRLVRHKGFSFSTLHNDVAILTLDRHVKFTREIHPICLPHASTRKSYTGQIATAAGWGSLRENGPQPSVLQKVSIPVWSNTDCARKYGRAAPGGIIESMMCAGQASKDSCSGDSGGPLMINEQGTWTQVGIVSWGIGCGKGQYPGVYTRVTSLLPWIMKNLK